MTNASETVLIQMVADLRKDFAQERDERRREAERASESRAVTHGRIDEMISRMGQFETAIALGVREDAQMRADFAKVEKAVADNSRVVVGWKWVQRALVVLSGLFIAGLGTLGGFAAWGGDVVASWVRVWLDIVPK